jgi:hypothetical protein
MANASPLAPIVVFVTTSLAQVSDGDAGPPLALTAGVDGILLMDTW